MHKKWMKPIGTMVLGTSLLLTLQQEPASAAGGNVINDLQGNVLEKTSEVVFTDVGMYEILSYYAAAVRVGVDLNYTDAGVELSFNIDEVFDEYSKRPAELKQLLGASFFENKEQLKATYGNTITLLYVENFNNPTNIQVDVYSLTKSGNEKVNQFAMNDMIKFGSKAVVPTTDNDKIIEEEDNPNLVVKDDEKEDDSTSPIKEEKGELELPTLTFSSSVPNFKDIKGNYAEVAIVKLYQAGIVKGTSESTYGTNDNMSRIQFAAMLARTLDGYGMGKADISHFKDVSPTHWAKDELALLYNLGIVSGTSDTTFSPNKAITRQQASAMLERYLKVLGMDTEQFANNLAFNDTAKISDYAVNGVNLLTNMGVVNGKPGNVFDPQGDLTRGQMAKILWGVLTYGE